MNDISMHVTQHTFRKKTQFLCFSDLKIFFFYLLTFLYHVCTILLSLYTVWWRFNLASSWRYVIKLYLLVHVHIHPGKWIRWIMILFAVHSTFKLPKPFRYSQNKGFISKYINYKFRLGENVVHLHQTHLQLILAWSSKRINLLNLHYVTAIFCDYSDNCNTCKCCIRLYLI